MLDHLIVAPGERPQLDHRSTDDKLGLTDKLEASKRLEELRQELTVLQGRLWAESDRAMLVVLQAMDAAGKDGTIRMVFSGVNPQGCRVVSFKAPSENELERDYLWRCHAHVPASGEIGIWNRSHYEDVLVVRVNGWISEDHARKRLRHIREFETLLADEGTTIVKIYLHVSEEEQRERLQSRLDDPEKHWKFRRGDLDDRARWPQFMRAYEEAIQETSTDAAPWYVVPADRKWVRNVAVSEILVETLRRMDPQIPKPAENLEGIIVR
jgi:PPK2 family polyphosphate:nucleotide phosphotransferase